jgi:simple sugar transport system permease protein
MNRLSSIAWAAGALAALLMLNYFFTPGFFHVEIRDGHLYGSLVDVLNRAAPVMLLSLGMTLVISTGGIDLSVGSIMAVGGSVAAQVVASGHGGTLAIAAGLAIGLVAGLANGAMVAFAGIQPIVATLILMVSGRGIAQLITDGQPVPFSNNILEFLGGGFFLSLPFTVTVVVVCALALGQFVRRTAIGLYLECVGAGPAASRLTGIPVPGILLFAYGICGMFAALAGLLITSDIKSADANTTGINLELDAILAVVIGGTSLLGGRFTLIGSLIGALLMQSLTTTILSRGVQVEFTQVVKAVVILVVCMIQSGPVRERIASLTKRRTA